MTDTCSLTLVDRIYAGIGACKILVLTLTTWRRYRLDDSVSCIIIPHLKIVSRDWLAKAGHSIMSTDGLNVTPSGEYVNYQSSVTLTL